MLGPLEARVDDRSIALGGMRQRGLLALLLLRPNEVVSRDRLIDELWRDHAPETAANALAALVARLRRVLPADVLVTRSGGYEVQVEPETVDVYRFERLLEDGSRALAAGDAAGAADHLHSALSLWRGRPLADFTYEPFAEPAILRLEELRLGALENRIDADLALGRHGDLVGELQPLVADHPLRERFRGQLMLALYRSGRQAEALEVYRDGRRVLLDELGIDPSPALQDLEKAILRQDPVVSAPEPVLAELRAAATEASLGASGAPVTEGTRALADEVRPVTIVFADVVGSTALGRASRAGGDQGARRRVRDHHEPRGRGVRRDGAGVSGRRHLRVLRRARCARERPGACCARCLADSGADGRVHARHRRGMGNRGLHREDRHQHRPRRGRARGRSRSASGRTRRRDQRRRARSGSGRAGNDPRGRDDGASPHPSLRPRAVARDHGEGTRGARAGLTSRTTVFARALFVDHTERRPRAGDLGARDRRRRSPRGSRENRRPLGRGGNRQVAPRCRAPVARRGERHLARRPLSLLRGPRAVAVHGDPARLARSRSRRARDRRQDEGSGAARRASRRGARRRARIPRPPPATPAGARDGLVGGRRNPEGVPPLVGGARGRAAGDPRARGHPVGGCPDARAGRGSARADRSRRAGARPDRRADRRVGGRSAATAGAARLLASRDGAHARAVDGRGRRAAPDGHARSRRRGGRLASDSSERPKAIRCISRSSLARSRRGRSNRAGVHGRSPCALPNCCHRRSRTS